MDRSVQRVAGPYRVTFSREAWKLIGIMPAVAFRSLQHALDRIAETPHRVPAEGQARRTATLDELAIVYALDDATRTLVVVDVVEKGARKAL